MIPEEKKHLKFGDYASYSLANFCQSILFGLVQGYLFIFYTSVFMIHPAIVGTAFLVVKIWDGINDPIMGTIIDRTRSKWGKMRPYLIFGAIPFSLVTISLFIPWNISEGFKIVYMFVTFLTWEAFSTVVDVPMAGISAIVSSNTNERTKIISVGRIAGSAGGEVSTALVALAFLLTKSAAAVYIGTAVVAGILELGSVWNTMPAHTHERRMEVYFYFDLSPEARVFHLMGQPGETRHIVVGNEQAVISPSWSIHSGVSTGRYTFIWGMAGENQTFDDMDPVPMAALR